MTNDKIVAYEDHLLRKEGIIRLAFVVDLVILAGAVFAYGMLRFSEFPSIADIMIPLILGVGLYALLNRSELKHIATIKRYRGLDYSQPQPCR